MDEIQARLRQFSYGDDIIENVAVSKRPFWLDVQKFLGYIKPCQRENPKKKPQKWQRA